MSSDHIVGIDLGTTNSLVAYMQGDSPVVIPGEDGLNLVPSVVALDEKNQIVVGNAARRYLIETPERAVYSVKRLMGRGLEDIRDELKLFPFRLAEDLQPGEVLRIKIGERTYTPPEISAQVLRQLKRNAERFFGAPVTQAVITVPAYFNDAQRQATKDAGRIAGLNVLRLVNEPTAASLAYGLDKKKNGIVAVYDLGGGTFDISILKLHDGIFEVISTNGDTHLGGDDIDNLLIAIALDDIRGELGLGIDVRRSGAAVQRIRQAMIEAKIALSSQPTAKVDVDLPGGKKYQREISLEVFEQMIQPIMDRTVGPCKQALKDAGLKPEQIDEVVLVGGSTRIPKVRRLVQDLFARMPHTDLNPDEVVALGAAVQANILGGGSEITKEMLLLDVTPLSLGIEVAGGVTDKVILRNSTVPASATQYYTTQVDGQTNVAIHVLQGERELARDCRSLARFDLKGVPPMPAGLPRIEVKFLIDANGILRVSAREQRSGQEAEIDVQPSYGLTDEQVENMLLESFDCAEEDFRQRQVIEARREADTILTALGKAKNNHAWQELTNEEHRNVETLEKALVAVKDGDDYHAIRAGIDTLNEATMHLAELMMDTAVSTALKGRTMDDTDLAEGPQAGHPVAKAEFE
ncbi:MAG TPA: Fe-S protein assembly chaperone HscA [Terriglobales bacterium]|nr:Fe-S protein assembly chaperone HscA [Terriglobales bacterium]